MSLKVKFPEKELERREETFSKVKQGDFISWYYPDSKEKFFAIVCTLGKSSVLVLPINDRNQELLGEGRYSTEALTYMSVEFEELTCLKIISSL